MLESFGPDIVAVGAGLVCWGLGWLSGRRRRSPKDPKPICGCHHHYSFHDPETKACHGTMRGNPLQYNEYGDATAYEQVQCSCKQYTGPEPLPVIYAG